ncbi:hypothetical protein [Streptomyces kanasensis]|uniref:hypothetical protein n=1 Tax=Streptomyces kanasensis TaxID=936756 RepID=UPI0036F51A0D
MPQQQSERPQPSDVSMRDLLASCAAADAVSTPPRRAPVEDTADDAAAGEADGVAAAPAEGADGADGSAGPRKHQAPRAA